MTKSQKKAMVKKAIDKVESQLKTYKKNQAKKIKLKKVN